MTDRIPWLSKDSEHRALGIATGTRLVGWVDRQALTGPGVRTR